MPPRDLLGWFTQAGDCAAIAEWARSVSTRRLGIALDMLCYGGLVASRSPEVELPTALARLAALRELRRRRADAVIFAFSTIMRLGTTVASTADLQEHLLLRSYCQLLDRAERLGEQAARGELEAARRQLDPDRLSEYLAVRRRNHAVNRAAVELVSEGVIDYLVLAQEDAAPVGIHLPEQLALRGQIDEFRVHDSVAVTCGADEMTMMLMARHMTAEAGLAPGIAADFAVGSGADVVPAFESESLRETLRSHLEIAGGRPETLTDCDAILFLHTPIGTQSDIAQAPPPGEAPSLAMQAESMVDRVEAASSAGRLFGLADVAYCNGADPELIAALERRQALPRLAAFAGWNTAANTLGTVISQLCAMTVCPRALRPEAAWRFLAARLIDDYGYQSRIRSKAASYAEQIGADPFRLGAAAPGLEGFISKELAPLAHRYVSQLFPGRPAGDQVRVSLPWSRLFEIELEIGW